MEAIVSSTERGVCYGFATNVLVYAGLQQSVNCRSAAVPASGKLAGGDLLRITTGLHRGVPSIGEDAGILGGFLGNISVPSPFPNPVTTISTSPPLPGTGINAFNYGGGDIDGGSLTALAGYGIKALCQTGLIRFSPCARAFGHG